MKLIAIVLLVILLLHATRPEQAASSESLILLAVAGNPEAPNIDERLVVLKQQGQELRTILSISNFVWNQSHRVTIPPYAQVMLPTFSCQGRECLLIYNYNYVWNTPITGRALELLTHPSQISAHILRIRENVVENLTEQLLKTPTLDRFFGPGKCGACDFSLYSAASDGRNWLLGGSLLIRVTPSGMEQLHITNEKGQSLIRETDGRLIQQIPVISWDGSSWILGHPHRLLKLRDRQLSVHLEFPPTMGLPKNVAANGDNVLVAGWQHEGLGYTTQLPGLWSYAGGVWKNATDTLPESYFRQDPVSGDYAYILRNGHSWLLAYESYFSRPRVAEYIDGHTKDYTNLLPPDFRLHGLFISQNRPIATDGDRWVLLGSVAEKKNQDRFRVLEIRDGIMTDLNLKFPPEIGDVLAIQLLSSTAQPENSWFLLGTGLALAIGASLMVLGFRNRRLSALTRRS